MAMIVVSSSQGTGVLNLGFILVIVLASVGFVVDTSVSFVVIVPTVFFFFVWCDNLAFSL